MNGVLRSAAFAVAAVFVTSCGVPQTVDSAQSTNAASAKITPSATNDASSTQFRRSLEMFDIRFTVESPNRLAGNTVTVTPSGLKVSNDSFTSPANGEVIDAQVGDLNRDQSPEVYVFVRERGGNGRINVIAYGTNSRRSMSEFILPEPDTQLKEYAGYNGNDEFEVVENVLSRRFPLFEKAGAEMRATGKTRIVQYKIKQGEATWRFYVHRFDEF